MIFLIQKFVDDEITSDIHFNEDKACPSLGRVTSSKGGEGLARNDVDKSRKMIPFLSSATALTEMGGGRRWWFLRNGLAVKHKSERGAARLDEPRQRIIKKQSFLENTGKSVPTHSSLVQVFFPLSFFFVSIRFDSRYPIEKPWNDGGRGVKRKIRCGDTCAIYRRATNLMTINSNHRRVSV